MDADALEFARASFLQEPPKSWENVPRTLTGWLASGLRSRVAITTMARQRKAQATRLLESEGRYLGWYFGDVPGSDRFPNAHSGLSDL